MDLHIKNMVSRRCTLFVKQSLQELGIEYESIELGLVRTREALSKEKTHLFREKLLSADLDLVTGKKEMLVERIKNLIIRRIHYSDESPHNSDSEFLQEELGYDYTYLSNTFSDVKGMTIKQYIILNKIERAKELLLYGEQTLTEIAEKLHYSSVSYLSNQFKEVTGMSPSEFKEKRARGLSNLEDI